jgi:hypothetical protein
MILTNVYRSINAAGFQDAYNANLWCVLGQYDAWTSPYSDTSPPTPSASTTSVPEAFCAIQATCYMVLEDDPSGTYEFLDVSGNPHYFNIDSSASDFISNGGNLVMAFAETEGSNISALQSSFRAIGFVTNLVATSGHQSDAFLPAANISSYGDLIMLEYRTPQTTTASEYQFYDLIQF